MSSDGVSTNSHFSVVEVLGKVLVAVYNLTAQDTVTNAISARTLSVACWTCGIDFITVHFVYKVDEYVYSDEAHHWSSFQSTFCNRSIDNEIRVKEYPLSHSFL
jgi:hypothetical protein